MSPTATRKLILKSGQYFCFIFCPDCYEPNLKACISYTQYKMIDYAIFSLYYPKKWPHKTCPLCIDFIKAKAYLVDGSALLSLIYHQRSRHNWLAMANK